MELFGLVLAGGKSVRMGFDKALLDFHGEPQVNWLYELLQSFCTQVFVSGNPKTIHGSFNFIEDYYQTGGPMNGILSSFQLHPNVTWLITPVDMPNVTEQVLSSLIQGRDKAKVATCFFSEKEKRIEPLPLVLEPSAYPLLLNRFLQGDSSLNKFLQTGDCRHVPVLDPNWLVNVNFPEQLKDGG